VVPISYAQSPARPLASDAALLAASVRIRVEDPQGHSCGSGTIIDALPGGEALVLTCGHLFRDSQGKGKVEIDLFGPAPGTHVVGRVISYDLERDVAFVAFSPQGPVTVARVAPRGYILRPGDAVASVGCDNGDDPTVKRSQINLLDRFLDPVEQRIGHKIEEPHAPWNVEVAGQPVEGRSGGGLFTADGLVIGICSAAEPPKDNEGIYSGLGAIHAALDEKRMTFVYQRPLGPPTLVAAAGVSAGTADQRQANAAADPFAAARGGSPAVRIPDEHASWSAPPAGAVVSSVSSPSSANVGPGTLSGNEQVTLDEIGRKLREGSEVVCIVRDRNDPKSQSEVFTLDRASPIFVNQLSRAAQSPTMPHETALEVPKRRTPIVEWDAEAGYIHQNPLPR
jgi:S1-C subfamily serine protease